LFVNKKKYTSRQEQIKYLGHAISCQGVATDPRQLKI